MQSTHQIFDWTINLGHVLTVLTLLGGGYAFIVAMRNQLSSLSNRVLLTEAQLIKVVEVLIEQGRQEVRLDAMDQRLNLQGTRFDRGMDRVEIFMDRFGK